MKTIKYLILTTIIVAGFQKVQTDSSSTADQINSILTISATGITSTDTVLNNGYYLNNLDFAIIINNQKLTSPSNPKYTSQPDYYCYNNITVYWNPDITIPSNKKLFATVANPAPADIYSIFPQNVSFYGTLVDPSTVQSTLSNAFKNIPTTIDSPWSKNSSYTNDPIDAHWDGSATLLSMALITSTNKSKTGLFITHSGTSSVASGISFLIDKKNKITLYSGVTPTTGANSFAQTALKPTKTGKQITNLQGLPFSFN